MDDRILNFKGTHKEIGEQVGQLYKRWGSDYSFLPSMIDHYSSQLKIYEKFYPGYLEFLEGIAKGVGAPKDKIFKFSLTIFLSVTKDLVERKCSSFAVRNEHGGFVGRNYDWRASSEKYSKSLSYEFTDRSAFNFKGNSDMGTWKKNIIVDKSEFALIVEDGWNDKGLYIGLNGAPGKTVLNGMNLPHLVQLVTETCENVNQAIALLEKVPTTNSHIFTLTDKAGNMVVAERSLEKGVFVRQEKQFIITTNHFNHPSLIQENIQIFNQTPFHSTFVRYHYLDLILSEVWKDINLEKIISILTKPPTLQNWRGEDDTVTLWTLALELKSGKYIVKFTPCRKTGNGVK